MRKCGPNLCVSSEEGLYDGSVEYKYLEKNLCPISRIEIKKRSEIDCTGRDPVPTDREECILPTTEQKTIRDVPKNTREVIHFRNKKSHNAATVD